MTNAHPSIWTLFSLLSVLSLSACELIADFDRTKIGGEQPLPNLPSGMVPGERPRDASMDAALGDAGLDDAGLDDAGLDDAGLDDAGLDAGHLSDASTADSGLDASDDAEVALDAATEDGGLSDAEVDSGANADAAT